MFTLTINGIKKEYNEPVMVKDLIKEYNVNALAAKVNGKIIEMNYYIYSDSFVEFVDTKDPEVVKMYESTLRYLILKVLYEMFPSKKVIVSNFVSRSLKFHIRKYNLTEDDVNRIKARLQEIIDLDLPIVKKRVKKEELIEIYKAQQYIEKVNMLKYNGNQTLKVYECDGYYNYMFSMMLPSTKYITKYEINAYDYGFYVQYPRYEENGMIPEFEDCEAFRNMIDTQIRWTRRCGIKNISDMNELVSTKEGQINFVNMCETKQSNMLAELGTLIESKKDSIKLIAIAGPSSSGKTTFCNKLRIELMTKGITPLMISIDDYYKDRGEYPLDENGNPDYEHLEALNVDLFNEHLTKLINGEEVALPKFNFEEGRSYFSEKKVKLEKGQPILIEGIHALNERLTGAIPRENKFKIFISPLAVLNFDNHSPISATDLRMLRRIVRDSLYRGASPENTLVLWDNVRKGEFKWIYPFQNEADYTYNTELTYEIMVMKKYALPALLTVKKGSAYYGKVRTLITFMMMMKDIDEKLVPCNSLLREFIGGSCFYE